MPRPHLFAGALAALILTAGPVPALDLNPLSAIKSAFEAVAEDRSAKDIAADLEIKAKITADVIDQMGTDVIALNVDVYEQDVMLTGSVETARQKERAGRLAAGVAGVRKVYNEIVVAKAIDKTKGAVENFVDDTVIETKINALLLDASGVNVTNFRWRSVGGHVFLFGRALSEAEHAKAVRVVKDIDNVVTVTSRAKVRPKE